MLTHVLSKIDQSPEDLDKMLKIHKNIFKTLQKTKHYNET